MGKSEERRSKDLEITAHATRATFHSSHRLLECSSFAAVREPEFVREEWDQVMTPEVSMLCSQTTHMIFK